MTLISIALREFKPVRMCMRVSVLSIVLISLVLLVYFFNIQNTQFTTEPELDPPLIIENNRKITNDNNDNNNDRNRITLLFVAGIEGTGHHLWLNITTTMSGAYPNAVDIQFYHSMPPYQFSQYLRDCFARDKGIGNNCLKVIGKLKQIYLDKYKDKTDFNALMHLRSFSYPFIGLDLRHTPNILKLKTMIERVNTELNTKVFVLRFIVSKREWVSALISCCINRYGQCNARVNLLPKTLHILNEQLMNLSDSKDWIMINYDDFVSRPLEYKHIIAEWLNINDVNIIESGLKLIDHKKGSQSATEEAWNIVGQTMSKRSANGNIPPQKLVGFKEKIIENFYSDNAKLNAPLFYDECVIVSPENKQFMNTNSQCEVLKSHI